MYEVCIALYDEPEEVGIKANWRFHDSVGKFMTRDEADEHAYQLANAMTSTANEFCTAHACDGFTVDVVDRDHDECVTSFEVLPHGKLNIWYGDDCHGHEEGYR